MQSNSNRLGFRQFGAQKCREFGYGIEIRRFHFGLRDFHLESSCGKFHEFHHAQRINNAFFQEGCVVGIRESVDTIEQVSGYEISNQRLDWLSVRILGHTVAGFSRNRDRSLPLRGANSSGGAFIFCGVIKRFRTEDIKYN